MFYDFDKKKKMDYQQALDFFKKEIKDGFCSPDCKDYQSALVAIKAIEKQIPKKPILKCFQDKYHSHTVRTESICCPTCHNRMIGKWRIGDYLPPYCSICGQSLENISLENILKQFV